MSFPRNFVRSGFRKRLTSTSVFCSSYNSLIWRICLRGVESEAHLIANRLHSIQTYNELYKVRLAHAQRNIFVRTYDRHNLDITARILLFTIGIFERDSLRRLMVPHNQLTWETRTIFGLEVDPNSGSSTDRNAHFGTSFLLLRLIPRRST